MGHVMVKQSGNAAKWTEKTWLWREFWEDHHRSGRWKSWKDLEKIDQASSGHVVNNPHTNIEEINIYLVSIVITYLPFATRSVYIWSF